MFKASLVLQSDYGSFSVCFRPDNGQFYPGCDRTMTTSGTISPTNDHVFSNTLVPILRVSGAGLSRAERSGELSRPLMSLRNELHFGAEGI